MHVKLNTRALTKVAKRYHDGRLLTLSNRLTHQKVCYLRVLSVVKWIKVEITDFAFRRFNDVFPDQIRKCLVEVLLDVLLSFRFEDSSFSVMVYAIQLSNDGIR